MWSFDSHLAVWSQSLTLLYFFCTFLFVFRLDNSEHATFVRMEMICVRACTCVCVCVCVCVCACVCVCECVCMCGPYLRVIWCHTYFDPPSRHRFLAPCSKLCQNWLCHRWAVFNSMQLSTNSVSAFPKVWVLTKLWE